MNIKKSKKEKLFIDPQGMDKIDDGFVLHPLQLKYANIIEKEAFDEVYIDNTPSSMLTHKKLAVSLQRSPYSSNKSTK